MSIISKSADAIELNRQQVETQERLQRIIQQREREILELQDRMSQSISTAANLPSSAKGVADEFDATMRIDPSHLPGKLSGNAFRNDAGALNSDSPADDPFDATTEISADDLEGAATVALDEESLAFARSNGQPKKRSSEYN